jgi:ring-1,2-phenylacetyl-CoA epoxidase subunit PaaB
MTVSDDQWPVYQVFERPNLGRPMRAAGSVHAVDAESALQNAWAVYGRRPTAVALWIVPRHVVLMKTKEQLAGSSSRGDAAPDPELGRVEQYKEQQHCEQQYCVFRQIGPRITYEEGAPVLAASPDQAMARALEQPDAAQCHAWWVFPASAITSSETASGECTFTPQEHKWFRDHKSFPVVAQLREIAQDERAEEDDDA